MSLDGVANCLHAAIEPLGNPSMDVRRACARDRQPLGPGDDFVVLFGGELTETTSPLDPERIILNEPFDGAREKADPPPAVDDIPLGDESMLPPAGDRLR